MNLIDQASSDRLVEYVVVVGHNHRFIPFPDAYIEDPFASTPVSPGAGVVLVDPDIEGPSHEIRYKINDFWGGPETDQTHPNASRPLPKEYESIVKDSLQKPTSSLPNSGSNLADELCRPQLHPRYPYIDQRDSLDKWPESRIQALIAERTRVQESLIVQIYKHLFEVEVLDRYPRQDSVSFPFPEGIPLFCVPAGGLRVKASPSIPHIYYFGCTMSDGGKLYGTCLSFQEQLTRPQTRGLMRRMELDPIHSSTWTNNELPSTSKALSLLSSVNKATLDSVRNINPNTIPLQVLERVRQALPSVPNLWTSHCICVLSHFPFLNQFRTFLSEIYRLTLTPTSIPLERLFSMLVDDTPLPPPGQFTVQLNLGPWLHQHPSVHSNVNNCHAAPKGLLYHASSSSSSSSSSLSNALNNPEQHNEDSIDSLLYTNPSLEYIPESIFPQSLRSDLAQAVHQSFTHFFNVYKSDLYSKNHNISNTHVPHMPLLDLTLPPPPLCNIHTIAQDLLPPFDRCLIPPSAGGDHMRNHSNTLSLSTPNTSKPTINQIFSPLNTQNNGIVASTPSISALSMPSTPHGPSSSTHENAFSLSTTSTAVSVTPHGPGGGGGYNSTTYNSSSLSTSTSSSGGYATTTFNYSTLNKAVYNNYYTKTATPYPLQSKYMNTLHYPPPLNFKPIHFTRPPLNSPLAPSSITLSPLFFNLDIIHVITIVEALLNEQKVLILSDRLSLLVPVCEALQLLLYPFRWVYVYVPLLPKVLNAFLNAPMPYLIGTPSAAYDIIQESGETDVLVVFLDKNTIQLPTSDTSKIIPLPEKHKKKLIERITSHATYIKSKTPKDHHSPKYADSAFNLSPLPDDFEDDDDAPSGQDSSSRGHHTRDNSALSQSSAHGGGSLGNSPNNGQSSNNANGVSGPLMMSSSSSSGHNGNTINSNGNSVRSNGTNTLQNSGSSDVLLDPNVLASLHLNEPLAQADYSIKQAFYAMYVSLIQNIYEHMPFHVDPISLYPSSLKAIVSPPKSGSSNSSGNNSTNNSNNNNSNGKDTGSSNTMTSKDDIIAKQIANSQRVIRRVVSRVNTKYTRVPVYTPSSRPPPTPTSLPTPAAPSDIIPEHDMVIVTLNDPMLSSALTGAPYSPTSYNAPTLATVQSTNIAIDDGSMTDPDSVSTSTRGHQSSSALSDDDDLDDLESQAHKDQFKLDSFLKSCPKETRTFLSMLAQSQAFSRFIDERSSLKLAQANAHHIIYLHESIIEKKTRQSIFARTRPTPFIASKIDVNCDTILVSPPLGLHRGQQHYNQYHSSFACQCRFPGSNLKSVSDILPPPHASSGCITCGCAHLMTSSDHVVSTSRQSLSSSSSTAIVGGTSSNLNTTLRINTSSSSVNPPPIPIFSPSHSHTGTVSSYNSVSSTTAPMLLSPPPPPHSTQNSYSASSSVPPPLPSSIRASIAISPAHSTAASHQQPFPAHCSLLHHVFHSASPFLAKTPIVYPSFPLFSPHLFPSTVGRVPRIFSIDGANILGFVKLQVGVLMCFHPTPHQNAHSGPHHNSGGHHHHGSHSHFGHHHSTTLSSLPIAPLTPQSTTSSPSTSPPQHSHISSPSTTASPLQSTQTCCGFHSFTYTNPNNTFQYIPLTPGDSQFLKLQIQAYSNNNSQDIDKQFADLHLENVTQISLVFTWSHTQLDTHTSILKHKRPSSPLSPEHHDTDPHKDCVFFWLSALAPKHHRPIGLTTHSLDQATQDPLGFALGQYDEWLTYWHKRFTIPDSTTELLQVQKLRRDPKTGRLVSVTSSSGSSSSSSIIGSTLRPLIVPQSPSSVSSLSGSSNHGGAAFIPNTPSISPQNAFKSISVLPFHPSIAKTALNNPKYNAFAQQLLNTHGSRFGDSMTPLLLQSEFLNLDSVVPHVLDNAQNLSRLYVDIMAALVSLRDPALLPPSLRPSSSSSSTHNDTTSMILTASAVDLQARLKQDSYIPPWLRSSLGAEHVRLRQLLICAGKYNKKAAASHPTLQNKSSPTPQPVERTSTTDPNEFRVHLTKAFNLFLQAIEPGLSAKIIIYDMISSDTASTSPSPCMSTSILDALSAWSSPQGPTSASSAPSLPTLNISSSGGSGSQQPNAASLLSPSSASSVSSRAAAFDNQALASGSATITSSVSSGAHTPFKGSAGGTSVGNTPGSTPASSSSSSTAGSLASLYSSPLRNIMQSADFSKQQYTCPHCRKQHTVRIVLTSRQSHGPPPLSSSSSRPGGTPSTPARPPALPPALPSTSTPIGHARPSFASPNQHINQQPILNKPSLLWDIMSSSYHTELVIPLVSPSILHVEFIKLLSQRKIDYLLSPYFRSLTINHFWNLIFWWSMLLLDPSFFVHAQLYGLSP